MNHFQYRNGTLSCEDVPLSELADHYGTPLYVYSHATLERHFRVFDGAFADVPHLTCYAVKASSNLALLSLIARWGGGMDVVSGGELYRALSAGADPAKIVFAGGSLYWRVEMSSNSTRPSSSMTTPETNSWPALSGHRK